MPETAQKLKINVKRKGRGEILLIYPDEFNMYFYNL